MQEKLWPVSFKNRNSDQSKTFSDSMPPLNEFKCDRSFWSKSAGSCYAKPFQRAVASRAAPSSAPTWADRTHFFLFFLFFFHNLFST
jgi:hypothetical protein